MASPSVVEALRALVAMTDEPTWVADYDLNASNKRWLTAWTNARAALSAHTASSAKSPPPAVELRDALAELLDVFERSERGFPAEVERRFAAADNARAALSSPGPAEGEAEDAPDWDELYERAESNADGDARRMVRWAYERGLAERDALKRALALSESNFRILKTHPAFDRYGEWRDKP